MRRKKNHPSATKHWQGHIAGVARNTLGLRKTALAIPKQSWLYCTLVFKLLNRSNFGASWRLIFLQLLDKEHCQEKSTRTFKAAQQLMCTPLAEEGMGQSSWAIKTKLAKDGGRETGNLSDVPSDILSGNLLAFFLASFLAHFLTVLLNFFWHISLYLLAIFLAHLLTSFLTLFLTSLLTFCVTFFLTVFLEYVLTFILTLFVTYLLTFFLAFLAYLLTFFPDPLTFILAFFLVGECRREHVAVEARNTGRWGASGSGQGWSRFRAGCR